LKTKLGIILALVLALSLVLVPAGTVAAEGDQASVTVRVTTGEDDPLPGVAVAKKFSATGATSWFPGGPTDANGEISANFDVGTELWLQARPAGSSSEWKQLTVAADKENLVEFRTTTVIIDSMSTQVYRVSWGGPTGQARWLSQMRHIFPGTYVFHFNGLGRINLPVSGDVMNLVEDGIEYVWRPPVYEDMVIKNRNATTPFKFQVVIAGFPIIMDNYYNKESVELKVAGHVMADLAYSEDKQEFKAHFKVRDYADLVAEAYKAEIFYGGNSVSTLNFSIE